MMMVKLVYLDEMRQYFLSTAGAFVQTDFRPSRRGTTKWRLRESQKNKEDYTWKH